MRATGTGLARHNEDSPLALRPSNDLMQSHHRITLTRDTGSESMEIGSREAVELFFGAALPRNVSAAAFTFPPLPPAGTFDARFEQDFFASSSPRVDVHLQRSEDTIRLKLQQGSEGGGSEYRVTEFMGPVELSTVELTAGQEHLLNAHTTRLHVESLEAGELPADFELGQNYPNPFNPTTTIRYALPQETPVRIELYSVLGQRVAILVNETRPAGWHTVNVDASMLSTGTYIYRISAGGFTDSRKMILVK